MGVMLVLQAVGLVIQAFVCSVVIQGSAVPPSEEGTPGPASNGIVYISIAPVPLLQPNGTGLQPPLVISPSISAPAPQTAESLPSPPLPSPPSTLPSNPLVPSPTSVTLPSTPPIPPSTKPQLSAPPPVTIQVPGFQYAAPAISPSSSSPPNKQTPPSVPESTPPNHHQPKAPTNVAPVSPTAPVPNVPSPRETSQSPPPDPVLPPSLPPDVSPHPALPGSPPPVIPISTKEPPSSPPEQNAYPISVPSPSISHRKASSPVAAPTNRTAHHYTPTSHSPAQGTLKSAPQVPSSDYHHSPMVAPSPSEQAKNTFATPKTFPSGPSTRSHKIPLRRPFQALPAPPPQKDCAPLSCTEPLTYGPPESPCFCVLPIQVGLRLGVALYTFFPLVSELASEIAAGVFMKQSQVRIMGANAAADSSEKTIALIDLLPLGEKFDETTAYLTFERFWHKQLVIKTSLFGNYDVLYVRYPGLPPSPPLPPSTIGIIPSKPYPGHDNNGRTVKPLGVDVSGKQHKHGFSRGILATIIFSALVAVILVCALAWVLLIRYRHHHDQPDPTPPTEIHSLAKSSGRAVSIIGSGPSSPPFSLGSSMAAYTGSAKTFSLSDIERATEYFNETRILGEGGFGRVYSGVLEDGTKIAVKLLRRYDQQGDREFLAEVEMLSRLHHRNLVKLFGICVADRIRCLVYELIPNGSLESHLHGPDKETSPLDWSARLKIALGAARALAYLHEDSSPRVIHRDFKASNILLEEDFTPKVSDFGLARTALDGDNRHISTRVMGTFGYVAPEYAMTGHLLVKSDVYSYGVVLLELLTGRKPVDMSLPPGQENLVSWARPLLTSTEGLHSIIDRSLGPDFPFDSISKVAAITSMCVQPEVSHRPFMGEVVQALKLICNECDEMRELQSTSSSHEDLSLLAGARDSTNSDLQLDRLLTQSPVSDYDYRLDVERDVSMSELLSSSAKFEDGESFRRHSSSGPLRKGKAKQVWNTMRRLSGPV